MHHFPSGVATQSALHCIALKTEPLKAGIAIKPLGNAECISLAFSIVAASVIMLDAPCNATVIKEKMASLKKEYVSLR